MTARQKSSTSLNPAKNISTKFIKTNNFTCFKKDIDVRCAMVPKKIEKRHIMKKLIWMSSYNISIYACIQADLLSDRREREREREKNFLQ